MISHLHRVLLVRPEYHGVAENLGLLRTEPLELEYLARAVRENGGTYHIFDGTVDSNLCDVCKEFGPTIVAITGYYPARDTILSYAAEIKNYHSEVLIVVGGVHAELQPEDFYHAQVDVVVHSGGYFTFKRILETCNTSMASIPGISYRPEERKRCDEWRRNESAEFSTNKLPSPDRTYFNQHVKRFNYLHHGPVALLKTAFGCPFECSFCCCRLLNRGKYSVRPLKNVVDEIQTITTTCIWIIDDTFLIDRQRIQAFAQMLEEQQIAKKFIIYARASEVCTYEDLLPVLKNMGVIEVIVGLESVDDECLLDYKKQVSADQNSKCIALLKKHGIAPTGLFIVNHDASAGDFRRLDRWISVNRLTSYTLSVFSPFPGTAEFPRFSKRLVTDDPCKWNLFSLVLAPERLSRFGFLVRLYWLQTKVFFKNRNVALLLLKRLMVWP